MRAVDQERNAGLTAGASSFDLSEGKEAALKWLPQVADHDGVDLGPVKGQLSCIGVGSARKGQSSSSETRAQQERENKHAIAVELSQLLAVELQY